MPENNPGHGKAALLLGAAALVGLAAAVGYFAGQRAGSTGPAVESPAVDTQAPVPADTAGFVTTLVGEWQGPGERLLIRNDKGVVEILRETRLEDGRIRLDQHVAAPVRLDSAERKLILELPDGVWQLVLLPDARRAQLSVTYPDKRNVLYQ